jgi:hypothetical protein
MIKSDTIGLVVAALAKAQQEFSPILKMNENPGFKKDGKPSKYADLATTIEATQPSLIKNGLTVIQLPVNEGDRIGVLCILAHESGEFIGESYTLPLAQQNAQTGVAAITYARRASLQAVLNCASEDDDGNTAAGNTTGAITTAAQPTPVRKVYTPPTQVRVPKAEIPATLPVSPAPQSKQVDAIKQKPTSEEMLEIRARFTALEKELKTAPGKLKAYLLKTVGVAEPGLISKIQWDTFFALTEKSNTSDLVTQINGEKGATA